MQPWWIIRFSLLVLWMSAGFVACNKDETVKRNGKTKATTTGLGITRITTANFEFVTTEKLKNCSAKPQKFVTTEKLKNCSAKTQNGTKCADHYLCPETNHDCNKDDRENCDCMEGYKKDSDECIAINQCADGSHTCGSDTGCRRIPEGGFYCECDEGYHKDNKTTFCPVYDITKDTCTDIDECQKDPGICGPNSNCTNTLGSYNCKCHDGYRNNSNKCEDIDECQKDPGICGPNSNCTNTPGSYNCKCDDGYRNNSNKCEEICDKSEQLEPCTDTSFLCILQNFTNSYTPECGSDISKGRGLLEKILDNLDGVISIFSYSSDEERLQNVGSMLRNVERIVQKLSSLEQSNKTYSNKKKTITINKVNRSLKTGKLLLQGTNSTISLNSSGNADNALLGCLEYSEIPRLMEGAKLLDVNSSKNQKFQVVSPVVSVFLRNSEVTVDQPIMLHLNFTAEVNTSTVHCVFWSTNDSAWSTEGCTKEKTHSYGIQCRCTHLTSFAVLMALHHIESWTLTLITKIGLSLSILCLALSIITFCFCRPLRGTRNTIHTHLCITLFMANCIFLLGITATGNKVLCGIVAGLLHAFYLSSFCWMALEGLELYLMLVKVFNTHLKTRYLLLVGYGVPAAIVIISASVNHAGYGTETHCWLSLKDNFIWSFMGPVCAIILATCGIFVLTVWKLAEKMTSINPEQGKLKRIRTLTVTAVAQLCILGCCWIFGFFMFSSSTLFFAYVFTILNTLQGVQIFLLHCLMHKKVREEYKRWIYAIAHKQPVTYSDFSNTNTQSKTKTTSKESGL